MQNNSRNLVPSGFYHEECVFFVPFVVNGERKGQRGEFRAILPLNNSGKYIFDRTIFIATRGNYEALIQRADSGRGTFSSVDRMIVRIQCAVAFGSWQFGAGG